MAACSHSQPDSGPSGAASTPARGSLSPAAPVSLSYQIEGAADAQPLHVNLVINTRLTSGALLVEVARQEGAQVLGETARRIDLAAAARPIALQMQVLPVGTGEHFLALLLTVETEMGPMSRSFRVDLTPASGNAQ
ncbi:MAG TPA: hypothetical protein VFM32_01155 [Spongiibacteraceae bacterium]|nr:hypothetical protein [Spongiibacteraceae bacterium]